MTYFTENILQNILSFCDDRIERRQKYYHNKLITDIKYAFDADENAENYGTSVMMKCYSSRLICKDYRGAVAEELYTMWITRDFEIE